MSSQNETELKLIGIMAQRDRLHVEIPPSYPLVIDLNRPLTRYEAAWLRGPDGRLRSYGALCTGVEAGESSFRLEGAAVNLEWAATYIDAIKDHIRNADAAGRAMYARHAEGMRKIVQLEAGFDIG